MTYVLDLLVILVVAITVIVGYHRGFLQSMVQLIGCVAAFILALTVSSPAASFVYDSFIAKGVETQLSTALADVTELPPADEIGALLEGVPKPIVSVLENSTQLQTALEDLSGTVATTTESLVQTVMESVIRPVAISLLQFVIFIVLFAVLLFVARLLAKLIKPVTKLPLVRQVDGALGAVLGALKGLLFVIALVAIAEIVAAAGYIDGFTPETVENTILTSWIADINPITKLIG